MGLGAAHARVDALEEPGDEGRGLAAAGLRLRDDIAASGDGHDGELLDVGRRLEAGGVDAAQHLQTERHVVELAVAGDLVGAAALGAVVVSGVRDGVLTAVLVAVVTRVTMCGGGGGGGGGRDLVAIGTVVDGRGHLER